MENVPGPGRGVSRVSATITHQSACLCGTGCKIWLGTLCRNRWGARRHENLWRISASAEARKEIWLYTRRCRCRCHRAVEQCKGITREAERLSTHSLSFFVDRRLSSQL